MRLQFFKFEADDSLSPTEGGWIDGYAVGGRQLEGVMFFCRVDELGQLAVRVRSSDSAYFNNLNKKKWLAAIKDHALQLDLFHSTDAGTDDDVVLYDHDKCAAEQQFGCSTPFVLNVTT